MGNSQSDYSGYQQRCDMCFARDVAIIQCDCGTRVCFHCISHAQIKGIIPVKTAEELTDKINTIKKRGYQSK
jgi:hypothetical protein